MSNGVRVVVEVGNRDQMLVRYVNKGKPIGLMHLINSLEQCESITLSGFGIKDGMYNPNKEEWVAKIAFDKIEEYLYYITGVDVSKECNATYSTFRLSKPVDRTVHTLRVKSPTEVYAMKNTTCKAEKPSDELRVVYGDDALSRAVRVIYDVDGVYSVTMYSKTNEYGKSLENHIMNVCVRDREPYMLTKDNSEAIYTRHKEAKKLDVGLDYSNSAVTVEVLDNGIEIKTLGVAIYGNDILSDCLSELNCVDYVYNDNMSKSNLLDPSSLNVSVPILIKNLNSEKTITTVESGVLILNDTRFSSRPMQIDTRTGEAYSTSKVKNKWVFSSLYTGKPVEVLPVNIIPASDKLLERVVNVKRIDTISVRGVPGGRELAVYIYKYSLTQFEAEYVIRNAGLIRTTDTNKDITDEVGNLLDRYSVYDIMNRSGDTVVILKA